MQCNNTVEVMIAIAVVMIVGEKCELVCCY
jgi:hypothetical protein